MELVNNYHKKHNLKEKSVLSKTQSEKVFKILENFEDAKASDIDDLSGMFLKEDEKLLTTSIDQLVEATLGVENGATQCTF